MTETLTMEAIADAGEIGITPALAARLGRACVGPPKEAAMLLAAPPEVERQRATDVGDVSTIDIASCIPIATRAHVLLKKSEPEHRTITAAFIDMMDTDRLLAEIGPDALAIGLDQRIRQIEEAALQFEVPFYETDVGKSSVKALLTAGAPSSTGHDEERMLRTLRQVMEPSGVVPMRIGVNTGRVFTGDFGPPYRRAYRVFGDAINTAARVMSKAEAGQILSTEIVLNRSRTIFETTPIEPFAAKGKALPLHASIVGPAIGVREAHHGGQPLVGRDPELQATLRAVEQTLAGAGSVVEITGEAGIGKSRLLEEVVARSPEIRIMTTRCEEYESATPYFPMRAIMRQALEVDPGAEPDEVTARLIAVVSANDGSLVPWVPLLGILLGLSLPSTPETRALDDRFLRERLAEVMIQFLAEVLRGPTILAIEDAQHLDEATSDLLVRLFAGREAHRAMLVLTHQSGEPMLDLSDADAEHRVHVGLGSLPTEQLLEILDRATEDDPLRPDDAEEIAARSGGNPLFLFELIDALQESGSIESLPDSVESLIAGEIDRLAPTDRTILRHAAVLGTSFDRDLLEAAVEGDVDLDREVWSRLGELLEVSTSGSVRFRNNLTRDVAYEGLPYRRRRALHERVGVTIERSSGETAEEHAAALALHFHEAQRWDKAFQYSRLAGDRAMKLFAISDASRFYERAIRAARRLRGVQPPDRTGLYERLSDALYLLGRYDQADRALKSARRYVRADPVASAPLAVKQAIITTRTGRYRQTNMRVARAIKSLEAAQGEDAAASRARLMVVVAGTRYFENRRVESIEWARRAAREARRSQAKDALAQAYKLLDLALKENGQIEKAVYSRRALALYEELGDLRNQALILNNLGILAQERSRWDEALELYQRALEIMDRLGDRANAGLAKYNIAEILSDQGRLDEAEVLLREVLRVWRASGAEADVAEARRELGKLFARRAEYETAQELFEAAEAEQIRAGKAGEALATAVRKRELDILAGRGPGALHAIDTTIEQANQTEGGSVFLPMLHRLRAWALVQCGRVDEGRTEILAALASARRRNDAFETALLVDALIATGPAEPAATMGLAKERQELAERLGIVSMPRFPIAATKESAPD